MERLRIKNREARWLWLTLQGLSDPPTGPLDTLSIIRLLGMVQLDTIRYVARAHHHIIWSRNQHYREPMLNKLLMDQRDIFEHFTHDAAVLPMEFYPLWQRQFRRLKSRIDRSNYYRSMLDDRGRDAIKERIAREGPLSTHAFYTKPEGEKKMWTRPPHKLALDYMWYCGELATSHRENFKKYYDLSERVIPADLRRLNYDDETQIDWLCREALDRLGAATHGEIQKFWEATNAVEVKNWAARSRQTLIPVEIQGADGTWSNAFAPGEIETRLADLKAPTSRLRILNPFDPVIRDRIRLKRLFGFDYRIEIFVPATKRLWGYYVFPLLEGDRFVGRLEVKADRVQGALTVSNIWPEPGVRWTRNRADKLEAELARLARFVSAETINWKCTQPQP